MNKEEIYNLLDKLDRDEWCTDLYKVPLTWCELYDIRDYINSLEQENKQLKELISTILNWNIFKNECPMNFGYDKNTIEDKSQEVFYQDDDYCENNCNEDYQKCWLKYFNKMQELEKGE